MVNKIIYILKKLKNLLLLITLLIMLFIVFFTIYSSKNVLEKLIELSIIFFVVFYISFIGIFGRTFPMEDNVNIMIFTCMFCIIVGFLSMIVCFFYALITLSILDLSYLIFIFGSVTIGGLLRIDSC